MRGHQAVQIIVQSWTPSASRAATSAATPRTGESSSAGAGAGAWEIAGTLIFALTVPGCEGFCSLTVAWGNFAVTTPGWTFAVSFFASGLSGWGATGAPPPAAAAGREMAAAAEPGGLGATGAMGAAGAPGGFGMVEPGGFGMPAPPGGLGIEGIPDAGAGGFGIDGAPGATEPGGFGMAGVDPPGGTGTGLAGRLLIAFSRGLAASGAPGAPP